MLGCLSERFYQIDPEAEITCYGQELNNQTFGIAKADMLIKGGNADNMRQGDTLGSDQFGGYKFDYIISNPPFGIEWKTSEKAVKDEHDLGDAGRFEPGLPAIGDGQMLFMLNGIAKLKDEGRMAIIQNGSSLFKGDAGSGESNIRGYLLEHDWLEAIVQLPTDLFYNTGIATYVWIITKNKPEDRIGKVQLIDASKCFEKRRKPLGNKRVEITDACRELIMSAYRDFTNWTYTEGELVVESKVKDVEDFKYSKLFINRPLKLRYEDMQIPEDAKLKPADRELLETIIKAHAEYLGSHPVGDFALFSMLKQQKIKTTQAQVKVVRQYLGTRDASYPDVYKKPLETTGSDYEWDSELADTEIIPWKQDIAEYLDKNVRPYAPDFSVDESKTKIGYEIPFTREFYKYVPLANSKDIFAELKALEEKEADLMNKILGGEA